MKTNKQSKKGKQAWEIPHLKRIDIKETATGLAPSTNPESGICFPS